jgi:bifunctional DNA-binding transcriptional regulator/antitoxin component of YhaV-PrlF toxin-antitoxin module
MPALEKRKVLPIGEGGRAITLPKPFAEFYNLEPKDEVTVLYDTILIVVPKGVSLSKSKDTLLKKLLEGESHE